MGIKGTGDTQASRKIKVVGIPGNGRERGLTKGLVAYLLHFLERGLPLCRRGECLNMSKMYGGGVE